jgi:hypothetical protein
VAIEFLTMWMELGDEARLAAAEQVERVLTDPDGPGARHIIAGLLNLNTLVLAQLMNERGATERDWLEKAQEYLRNMVPRLPE